MSNRNIFMDMGADTEVELHLKSNAMSFSKLFGDGEKIKSEYLPENAGGGNVDLGPLEARVAELESHLTTAQNMIDWLGGDLLRVTPMLPFEGSWVATRTFPLAVRLPEGIEARMLDKFDRLTKKFSTKLVGDGKNVPAHTPVLLFGKEKKEYVLSPGKQSLPIDTGLMGTVVPLRPEQLDHNNFNYYALAPYDGSATLVKMSATITFPAYRAYFRLPKDYFENPAGSSAS